MRSGATYALQKETIFGVQSNQRRKEGGGMDKLKPKTVKWPMQRVDIRHTDMFYELHGDDHVVTAHIERAIVRVIDMEDQAVYDAAIRTAYEAGIDILYFMDKQFVLDALREKLERDYYGKQ